MTVRKTDSDLKRRIIDELQRDPRVTETDVGVEVKAGTVTLSGTVDTWAARLAAQEAAHRVSGVLGVANEIRVKQRGSAEPDDTEIAQAARHALECDVRVPADRIRISVSEGVITLDGNVAHWDDHAAVGRCMRNLAGVRHVFNFIRVDPPPRSASIDAVRTAIDKALEKHAAHSAKHVRVALVNGDVTLVGHVPSSAERAAIEGAVRGTAGVFRVDNQLRVES